jgi:hypothetical protein
MARRRKQPKVDIPTKPGYYWTIFDDAMELQWIEDGVMERLGEAEIIANVIDEMTFISAEPVEYSEDERLRWRQDARAIAERIARFDKLGWDWLDGYYWINTPNYPSPTIGWFFEGWMIIKDYDAKNPISAGERGWGLNGEVLYGPLPWPDLPDDTFTTNTERHMSDVEIEEILSKHRDIDPVAPKKPPTKN